MTVSKVYYNMHIQLHNVIVHDHAIATDITVHVAMIIMVYLVPCYNRCADGVKKTKGSI